ncbi:hypothetical protein UZ36_06800 [Candidatus Nitromaritima sp. SCGC AAA799-C22]|nr:hypothetical protein UZ36_06800 [Candidatus Nitromaritima sp. SCGC AAA799-C22]
MAKYIPLLTLESRIKRKLRDHIREMGFNRTSQGMLEPSSNSKKVFRALHLKQRIERLKLEKPFIDKNIHLKDYFASGSEINPEEISPRLQLVKSGSLEERIFRLASLTWSIPVSRGYGRRMRFIIWDDHNNKIMGIIALGDPVFNLKARDDLIGWKSNQRKDNLVNVMDAYVLGALPPYNMLLCGKLAACLIRTREMQEMFSKKYGDTKGIISGKRKRAKLLIVTTSSALGRSSVYNRLKLQNIKYFQSIGYTKGWGHFHITNGLYEDMKLFLKQKKHRYEKGYQFGDGPSWKLRVVRTTLDLMGMNSDLLRHGIFREVFMCKLASNAERILRGEVKRSYCKNLLSTKEVAELALNRWVIPRSERMDDFKKWNKNQIADLLNPNKSSEITLSKRKKKRGLKQ